MKSEETPSILLLPPPPLPRSPASLARIPRVRHKCSASPNDELQPRTPDKWTNIVRLPLAIKHLAGMEGGRVHYRSWRVTIRSLDEGNAEWIRNEVSPIRRGCSIVPSRAFYKRVLPLSHALTPSSPSSSSSSMIVVVVAVIAIAQTSIDSLRTGKRVGEARSPGPDYDRVHRRVVSLHDLLGTRIDVRANLFTTSSLLSPILDSLSRTLHAWFIQIARPPRECFKSRSPPPGGGCLRDGYRFCRERERERDPVFREWMCNSSSLRLQGKIAGKI